MRTRVKVSNLKKQYGDKQVLKGISFSVKEGEIFALLGTNGAGKTTALGCIEGILKYNEGEINKDGKIGVQLQVSSLPEVMKGSEALNLFAKWNNTTVDNYFVERLDLKEVIKMEYKSMSIGQKRRLHLALAMTGNPDIIFLDEPTAGLDVEGRVALHEEIRKLKSIGKTIIMASHDMAEVENLCDRLVILKDGQIAFLGTVNDLTNKMQKSYKIHLKQEGILDVNSLKRCFFKYEDKNYYTYECNRIDDGLIELLTLAKEKNISVTDVKIENLSLEESFMDIAKGEE